MAEILRRNSEIPVSLPPAPDSWNKFLDRDAPIVPDQETVLRLSTREFLGHIDKLVVDVITSEKYHDEETGYISDEAWKRLVDGGLLSPFLNERNTATRQEEVVQLTRILSYHDLHLGLTYGIVGALGIDTIQTFGSKEQQEEFLGIVRDGGMIGLAVTDFKTSGTEVFDMVSSYEILKPDGENASPRINLNLEKHFQGNSDKAGLIVFVKKMGAGMTFGLFFVPDDLIKTERIHTEGLGGVSYAINTGEFIIDKKYLLVELSGNRLREFQDIFTKSRLLFVGMTLGHQERMEFEANNYAAQRKIGRFMQNELPVVRRSLNLIKARRIASEAMLNLSLRDYDTLGLVAQANIIKNLPTRYAIDSARMRAKLKGADAYHEGDAYQDLLDIEPFDIFEGPEPFLNTQIGSHLLRHFKNADGEPVPSFSEKDKYADFLDFFEKSISQKELFNGSRTLALLEDDTKSAIEKIKPEIMPDDLKEIMGRIISRMFALGCLDQEEFDSKDLTEVVSMLNEEIRIQVIKFVGRRENPLPLE